jgi:outer membrane receptor protein involved in Fe transport
MRMNVRALRRACFPRVILAGIAAAALCVPAFTQVTTSSFYGTVKDSTGGVVVGATVTLLNQSTGAAQTKQTDAAGDFGFDFLRVGEYAIKIEAPGFKTLESKGIQLQAGQNVRRAFTLEIGGVNETVSVEGVAPLVNAVSAEQTQGVTTHEAEQLPLAKRNIGNLLGLGTGVSPGDGFVRLNGVGKTGTLYTVDGTNATADPESRTTSMRGNFEQINLLSLEAVQQVETTKGILPAEYGQALGGNVNIITKSGTNNWHGSAFENFQSDNLNARLQFLRTKPNSVFNQFGGSLGGPIKRDKIFFFADYEGYRQSITQVLSGTVPTAEFRKELLAAVPVYATALEDLPLPNQSYAPGAESALYVTGGAQTAHDNHIDVKGDIHLTNMSNLALTYTHGRPVLTTPRIFLNNANDQVYHGFTERGTASYITGGASWTSETRFGYNLNDMDRTDAYFLRGISETIPFGGRLPDLVYTSFSTENSELWLEEGKTWSLEEKYARFAGKHSLKFGVIYMRFNVFRTNPENPKVSYNSRADLFANIPNSMQFTIGNGSYDGVNSTIGAFVQDNWRATPKLTVNLGVRYDYYSKFVATPREAGQDFGLYNFDGLLDNQFHFGPVRDPKDPYDSDGWVNLAPRLGFSYDPTGKGKTTIRGGYGVMFSPPAPGVFSGAVGGKYLPFRATLSRQEGITYGFHFPLYNDSIAPILIQQQRVRPTIVIDPHLQTPYVLSSYFGVQHALTSSLVLETAYVGNRGVKFPMNRTYNFPNRVTGIRPNPDLVQGYYVDNSQTSWYHSWQTSLRQRFSRNLTFAVNYTWGKQLSTDSGDIGAYYQNNANVRAQDFFDLRREWGPADGDVTHYFSANWVYELPGLNSLSNPFVRQAIGGWQVSGVFSAATGQPLVITQGGGEDISRPDYVGGDAVNSNYTETLQYLNKSAFAAVPISSASGLPIRPGTLGRSAVRGPGYWSLDFSLGKNFRMTEKVEFQVRADAFNAFNHTNLSSFATNLYSSAFGRFTNTRGARVIQLNARLSF